MNIGEFFTQYAVSLEPIMLSIFLGLICALGILSYNKIVCGRLVRHLVRNEIHTPEQAITLKDAGLEKNRLLHLALRDGTILRRMVTCIPAQENGVNGKGKTNLQTARFYLPTEKVAKAEISYDNNGTSVLAVLFTVVIFLFMMILVAILAPNLVTMFKNMISMFTSAN